MVIWRGLWKIVDLAMAAILAAMIVLVFTNAVLRYGFSSSLRQSGELARMGLVWITMLGAAVLLRRGEHLAIEEFSEAFLPKLVPLLRRLVYVVVTGSMVMLFWGAYKQMNANWENISQLTGLPSALFYVAGVISSVLMVLIGAVRIIDPDVFVPDDAQQNVEEEMHS